MKINEILKKALSEGRDFLMEDEAKAVLAARGIPITPCPVAHNEEESVILAAKLGYPIVLKIRSSKITHKSDCGGVYLNLTNEAAVRAAYREMTEKTAFLDPEAAVTVQPMAEKGVEVLIGVTADSQFGPVVAFGLGGIFTEVLKDVSFRMAPVDLKEAGGMIEQIKGSSLLHGYRGSPAADTGALERIISEVSRLAVEFEEIAEMDLNPVAAYPDGALVLDARIRIKYKKPVNHVEKGVQANAQ